jgi:hypothetical protein
LVVKRYEARAAQQERNDTAIGNVEATWQDWLSPARHVAEVTCPTCPCRGRKECAHDVKAEGEHFCTVHPVNVPLVGALRKIQGDEFPRLTRKERTAFREWIPAAVDDLHQISKGGAEEHQKALMLAGRLREAEKKILSIWGEI